jgi:hypothetical protein
MYYKLEYTDNLPEGKAGQAKFWFIKIRPSYKDDIGLLNHEIEHVRQFWRYGLLVHQVLYPLSKQYRLKCEVEAYKIQLKYYTDDRTELFAEFICNNYSLNVEKEDVIKMLTY